MAAHSEERCLTPNTTHPTDIHPYQPFESNLKTYVKLQSIEDLEYCGRDGQSGGRSQMIGRCYQVISFIIRATQSLSCQ
jgi:hypothetical protein